jgi:hypothetical protein
MQYLKSTYFLFLELIKSQSNFTVFIDQIIFLEIKLKRILEFY